MDLISQSLTAGRRTKHSHVKLKKIRWPWDESRDGKSQRIEARMWLNAQ